MRAGFFLRYALRDVRGARGRLAFFALCLAVGVAAIVAVAAVADGLDAKVRREAKQILGGDVSVRGSRPLPAPVVSAASSVPGSQLLLTKELVTMAAVPPRSADGARPRSLLVELKVLHGPYPLYGSLETAPAGVSVPFLADHEILVAPELLTRLELDKGDQLKIGEGFYSILGTVVREPDRVVSPFTLGPRVLMGAGAFSRTGLETLGSRIEHRLLWRLPGNPTREQVDAAAEGIRALLVGDPVYRLETYAEAQASLRDGLRRVEHFLGLVALLSLLVGGVGVAQSVRAFLASRLSAIAVLKCLGLRPREAFVLYLGQALALGLGGSLLGGLVGLVLAHEMPRLLGGLMPTDALVFWQPAALLKGVAIGMGTSALFALTPLASVLRVSPLRALRRDAEPLPASRAFRFLVAATVGGGLWILAATQSGSVVRGLQFVFGIGVTVSILGGAALGLRRICGTLRDAPLPLWARQGAAMVARPSGEALTALTALGLGVLVVLGAWLVQENLTRALLAELPETAPTAFFIDVQPNQWPSLESVLDDEGAASIDSVPVVMARLAAIDGRSVAELAAATEDDRGRRWALRREQRLTYLEELPPGNRLVAGRLWADPDRPEVSLEEEYARDLGVGLGSRLRFDLQGVPLELTVTSLRSVDWRTFRINFFLVAEPGVLEGAPQSLLAAAALAPGSEMRVQNRIADLHPNITVVDVRQVLETVSAVLRRLGLGIRFLGGFTAVAGIAILFGAVAAASVRRAREVALLKTLGFTRAGVTGVFSAELALGGGVAAIVGAAAAVGLAGAVVRLGLELPWEPHWAAVVLCLLGTVALTVAAGLTPSLPALARRPVEVLRQERE